MVYRCLRLANTIYSRKGYRKGFQERKKQPTARRFAFPEEDPDNCRAGPDVRGQILTLVESNSSLYQNVLAAADRYEKIIKRDYDQAVAAQTEEAKNRRCRVQKMTARS